MLKMMIALGVVFMDLWNSISRIGANSNNGGNECCVYGQGEKVWESGSRGV